MPGDWHCRAGLCQHLCAEAHEPLHAPLQIESGYTMEVVRSGSQYRQDSRLWGTDLAQPAAFVVKIGHLAILPLGALSEN